MWTRSSLITLLRVSLLLVLVLVADDYRFVDRFEGLTYTYGMLGGVALIGIWVISIAGLLLSALLPSLFYRAFLAAVFLVTTLVGMSYYQVSGRALVYDNLKFMLENNTYLGDALSHHARDISTALLVSLLSLLFLVPPSVSSLYQRLSRRSKVILYLAGLSPFIILFGLTVLRGGYGVQGMPMQYRVSSLLSLMAVEKTVYGGERGGNEVSIVPKLDKPQVNVVLIVEESLRADYVDLGEQASVYTPFLHARQKEILNFGYASSGANCSAESNQILRFGPNVNDFPRTFKANPSIWQYAQKANYRTYLVEGDAQAGRTNNRIGPGELRFIDQVIHAQGDSLHERDMEIARLIKQLTSEEGGQPSFLLAVKNGIHFPYDKRVPEGAKIFPSRSNGFDVATREDLVNSYINAVSYNIDNFFRELLEDNHMSNTVVIYTSDHGQNLLDNGHKLAHCSTEDTSVYEGLVPLFVLNYAPHLTDELKRAVTMNKDKASHFNIFPTMIELLGYESSVVSDIHGESLFVELSGPRKFLSGLLAKNRLGLGKRNTIQWHTLPESLISKQ